MVSEEFEKQYRNLNPQQKEAVDSVEGAVMVVAGPGTGKTKTLTLRIANILLKTQVNPENILALTFTESAAHEMRKRLMQIIGHDAFRVDITTFHSFANNFIKRHQEEFAHIISSESINEIDQLELVDSCINNLPLSILRPLGDLKYYVKPSMQAINKLKQENISPEEFGKGLDEFEKDLNNKKDLYHEKGAHKGKIKSGYKRMYDNLAKNRELLMVFEMYKKKLTDQKKYDYTDMLLEVIKKLSEHEYLLQYLQEKYQYFLVDENQDTNASQNKIIELISNYFDNPNLFIVGDEKQAIFRFQGATLSNFYNFRIKYPQAKLINLSQNYRSTKNILDATYELISHNPKNENLLTESHPLLKNSKNKEEKIMLAVLPSDDAEIFYVAHRIKELTKNTPAHEIAVLVRNNRDIEPIVDIFERERIPYTVEADNDILEDLDVQKQILLLKTISSKSNLNVERVLLLDCFGIDALDVFKINRYIFDEKVNAWDVLTDSGVLEKLEIKNRKAIENFVELFMGNEGLIKKAVNTRFDVLFVEVLNRSGLLKSIIRKPNGQEILSRMTRLYDEVKKQVGRNSQITVSEFINFIDLLEDHGVSLKSNTSIIPLNTVRVMTVHKSKGQEFDFVFIINVYDTHWGNLHNRGAKFEIPWSYFIDIYGREGEVDDNSDERRLFYVAMTRARKNVYISYSVCSKDGREQIPSQFLSEIPDRLIEKVDLKEFNEYFSSHQHELFTAENKVRESFVTKEYASELFRRQGLSVSALNNYLECPWKFFFVNLIRLPEKINNSNLFGSAIHGAFNQYLIHLKKGRSVSEKFLIEKFKEQMDLLPFSDTEKPRFIERGIKALSGFHKEQMKNWTKDMETELEIRGIRINEDLYLNGKLDLLTPLQNNTFDVTDFKTGKPKSRNVIEGKTKDGNGNYKRQLVFYKILLDRFRNGFFKMKRGIIEFVEPNDTGNYKREIFDITDQDIKELLELIKKVAIDVVNLKFWNLKCDNKDCEYCKLRKFMAG